MTNQDAFYNSEVLADWDIDRLLTDLEAKTHKRYRHNNRQAYLCALLQGRQLDQIGKQLHKKAGVVRAELSGLYRDIEELTNQPANSVRASNLVHILEQAGYRKSRPPIQKQKILCNLPAPTYSKFIGRKPEMTLLLQRISLDHATHIITVDGIGGVGKTTLVLEAAYCCLNASVKQQPELPKFDAIIFTSAKQQYLFPMGIVPKPQAQRNLHDILREIANTLDIQSPIEDQLNCVRQNLSKRRVLLIVDNMETMENAATQEVISFLYDLPANVKIVITSRERLGVMPISLPCLSKGESLRLIQQQALEKRIAFNKHQAALLHQRTGGIPIAIVYAIGQISSGSSLELVLERLSSNQGDVAQFCFHESVQKIQGDAAHALLMALAIFPEPPGRDTLVAVSGLAENSMGVQEGLARLQQLSLVTQKDGRYSMLALTREFVLAELKAHPSFEQQARERWVAWYKDFAKRYGGEDWERWLQFDKLKTEEDNLLEVLYWCKDQERYQDVRDILLLVNHYANLYGYWDDHLDWLQWLIESAERRGDWTSYVQVAIHRTWLLIRLRSDATLEEADRLLRQTWLLREFVDNRIRADLVENLVRLRIRQKKLKDARHWLDRQERYVIQADLEGHRHIRYFIPVRYHQAEIYFWEENYSAAQRAFQEVLESASRIGWNRVINSAQNWLADIAIKQGDLQTAERLLATGLSVAEKNKNRRRLARYQRSYAVLEQQRGNLEKAQEFAIKAREGFNRYGMVQDAREMQVLIERHHYE
ncbi:MAG: tetratricopeptide repeat protein [Leptolyngbyaceae cyanobacterium SL_7_1]|nr:tetratricopeptide repeat protein [Leptolyngbyaceae cyanobacterium SL_7_1]